MSTTYISGTQLKGTVPQASIVSPATAEVTVRTPPVVSGGTGGGTSNPLAFYITEQSTTVTGSGTAASTSSSGTATTSTSTTNSDGSITALKASGSGSGTLSIAQFASDPVSYPSPTGTTGYFDIYVASGSSFSTVQATDCNPNGGQLAYWWDTSANTWTLVSNQTYDPTSNCITLTFSGTSSPNLAQITRLEFAATKSPVVTVSGIANGAVYTLGAVPTGSCSAVGSGGGLTAPCSLTVTGGLTSGVGTFTFTATATDKAGRASSVNGIYKVHYRFDGFLQPINDTGHLQTCGTGCVLSVFKAASTVPAKFQLKKADGTVVQASSLPIWLTPVLGSPTTLSLDENTYADAPTTGSTYRWDSTSQLYVYNWSTPKSGAGYYWRGFALLDDGQIVFVDFALR